MLQSPCVPAQRFYLQLIEPESDDAEAAGIAAQVGTMVEGAVETSTHLLSLPFDHVFFTGSPAVGKVAHPATLLGQEIDWQFGMKQVVAVAAIALVHRTARANAFSAERKFPDP